MKWELKDLINSANSVDGEINGKQVPSRPINWKHETLAERFRNAWAVFVGKADAVVWPEGQ